MAGIRLYKVVFVPHMIKGVRAYWNFKTDIPELNIIAGPMENRERWPKRVEEEIRVFEIWRKFNDSVPFRNLKIVGNPKTSRRFEVEANLGAILMLGRDLWDKIEIELPLNYPYGLPTVPRHLNKNRRFWSLLESLRVHSAFLCIPPVKRAWWRSKRGRAGIAHFLNILVFYISVAIRNRNQIGQRVLRWASSV